MATARNDNIIAPATLTNDDIDMKAGWSDDLYPRPERFVFREIDFRIDPNGHLQFGFRNADKAEPLNGRTIEDVVEGYRPTLPLVSQALAGLPGANALAILDFLTSTTRTPLDLDVTGYPIYVIYRFFKPRNITFSPFRKALSHKNGDAQDRYGLLRHVGPAGSGAPSESWVDNCELVYFGCVPKTGDYEDGFNLRVQLEQEPHLGPPPTPRLLDLEIDPDIRHPGGSITEP